MAEDCTAGLVWTLLQSTAAQAASIAVSDRELSSLCRMESLSSTHIAAGGNNKQHNAQLSQVSKTKKRLKSQAHHTQCTYPTCRYHHWLFTECFFLSALLKALSAADTISLPQYTFNTQPAII
ncbi:TPA: hypothetical protein ACH3X1_010251 [Trebouxia sp. C0004]